MKKSLNFLLMLLMVATVFTGCTKKADPAPTPAQLIVGKWKIVTYTVTSGSSATESASACELDNISEFTASGSLIDTENTKCDPSDPATSTQTYSISPDGKALITGGATFNIGELTSTSLKLNATDTDNGTVETLNVTFTKI